MMWSFSDSRTFRACQRKWYFDSILANAVAKKEPIRREAYLLSKLQGLSAWRGNVVDYVIGEYVITGIAHHTPISLDKALVIAKGLFDRQVAFARAHRLREPNMKVTEHKGEFAAWHAIEYGEGVSEADLLTSWSEIKTAVSNLYEMSDLFQVLNASAQLITQRSLTFHVEDISVRATPDLIAFRGHHPPVIIDWKAYVKDAKDHRLQLACYAIALKSCEPHRDFPVALEHMDVTDIDLIEVQLITKKQRHYKLSNEDRYEVETYILESAREMEIAKAGLLRTGVEADRFAVAHSPTTCQFCSFRSLCWEE